MAEALRVAIVGAGPAGLYAGAELLRCDATASVDLFDRLPSPGGLVRAGVSPDHGQRRNVTPVYERLLEASDRFRFFGNVCVGKTLALEELAAHYHAVIHASGAPADRRLGIPGEDLPGSHSGAAFVGWYNGHPDFAAQRFDLQATRAVVIGNGNVALDLARMLLLPVDVLRRTDIADHALDALAHSQVREVVILGRRGPAQAAFTAPELLELATLPGVEITVEAPQELLLAQSAHPLRMRLLQELASRKPSHGARRLVLRFLSTPLEILEEHGRASGVRIAHNQLVADPTGVLHARATPREEVLPAGLVLRAVGYRAEAIAGLPFDETRGCVPHDNGRVLDGARPMAGHYVAGWLKRGPSGVIGSNKFCSRNTVASLLADALAGRLPTPRHAADVLPARLHACGVQVVDYHAWKRIDRHERRAGVLLGRPRVKQVTLSGLLQAAG